jgi:ferrochelatase
MLVHGLIAPLRAPKSAHAYQKVWSQEGSPLLSLSQKFLDGLRRERTNLPIELGMRYGQPSIRFALEKLRAQKVETLKVIPLYPQFAKSSSLTAMESVIKELRRMNWAISPRFLQDFFEHPAWIRNLAAQVANENQTFNADFLLMSYHGLPEHHIQELDKSREHCLKRDCCSQTGGLNSRCYRAQCFATSRALLRELDWPGERQMVSFQSRLGRRPWIKPYSDHVILDLAKKGVKRVLVACPSFVADCLETLEEVAIRMKRDFIDAGGQDLRLVPAVNEAPRWIADFANMTDDERLCWLTSAQERDIL